MDRPNGESLGGYMKQPKISDLEIDSNVTENLRKKIVQAKKIKITVNIDEDILMDLKSRAQQSGSKYQTLMNLIIRQALEQKKSEHSRLDRLEKELQNLKEQLSVA